MIVPAIVWRGGFAYRALLMGCCTGVFFGTIAWLDSGMFVAGAVVCVVLGVGSGLVLARRMTKGWPGAVELSGAQRVAVVDAARRGAAIGDAALAPAVADYRRALHASAEDGRPWRWLIVVILVVAIGMAVWDAASGSWGSAASSVIYLILIVLEVFWWPRRRAALLANADQAAELARRLNTPD